jgi:hypothetical protein
MKKTILLFMLVSSVFVMSAFAQKPGKITLKTSYKGIIEGYDHVNRTDVYVDGILKGSTLEQVQSKPGSCTISVPKGTHDIRIVNMAYYEGTWEEHTIANEYSLDALYEGKVTLKKKLSIELVFDIEKEQTFAKVK